MISWKIYEMLAASAYALILGLACGLLWDLIRFPRLLLSGRAELIAAFFGDIFFFIAAGAITAVFVFETCFGLARWYVIAGASVGFAVWRLTFGVLTLKFGRMLNYAMHSVARAFWNFILIPVRNSIQTIWSKTFGRMLCKVVLNLEVRRAKKSQAREYRKLLELCSTLYTKTEEKIYALYTNEHTGKAGGFLRFRLFDNNLREHSNKIQQSDGAARRVERQDRCGERVDRGTSK